MRGEILKAFINNWRDCWVNYTAITKETNRLLNINGSEFKKGSTIERGVRKLAQEGLLESNGKGDFKLVGGNYKYS